MNARADSSSPDFMAAPGRGKGVRRLNRLPLMIVGGLALLAVIGIAYTMLQRQAEMQANRGGTPVPSTVDNAARPPIQPIIQSETAGAAPPREPLVPANQPAPAQTPSSTRPRGDLEQRMRLIARIEENRLMSREAALIAEPVVSGFRRRSDLAGDSADSGGADGLTLPDLSALANIGVGRGSLGGMGGSGVGRMGMPAGLNGMFPSFGQADPNRQDDKRAFLAEVPASANYLSHTRLPALSPMEVKAGTIIPGVMIGGVNSDLPGQIIGQVRQDIYDTATGQHLLIPAGARLIGIYDSRVTMGQRRVLVAWNRIIFPDGSSLTLDTMPGADVSGYAGFRDKINNHYWRIFGNAFMLSLFSAGIQLSQPDAPVNGTYNSQQIMAAELGRQLGELGMEVARRNLDIQPTLEIRPGYQFTIMITKDMVLPPWQGHPLAVGQQH